MAQLAVLIATSQGRMDLLFSRSLKSVLNQTVSPSLIVIVDDNDNSIVSDAIEYRIKGMGIDNLRYLSNSHTHGMSGTGAWNTGIEDIKTILGEDSYTAFLDDDDEWAPNHLEVCLREIEQHNPVGVFPWLHRTDMDHPLSFTQEQLTITNFLIGDPGIQGSNMVIRTGALVSVGCFDETLPSCTDRDIMISLLRKYSRDAFSVLDVVTVTHYASKNSVTGNRRSKHSGLAIFYRKHLAEFKDKTSLERSLTRASALFGYDGSAELTAYDNLENIAIGVATHNGAKTIRRCLSSILRQEGCRRHIKVVIGADSSTDDWRNEVSDILDELDEVVLTLSFENVVKTRNEINNYILSKIENVRFLGRLDDDDVYASDDVLKRIEEVFDSFHPDVVIGGNGYLQDSAIIDCENMKNERLVDIDYLHSRLEGMTAGRPECELPSCNLFVIPASAIPYPSYNSAEDHYLTLYYLMHQEAYKVIVTDDIKVAYYNLSGNITKKNKSGSSYLAIRKRFLIDFEDFMKDNERIAIAKRRLAANGVSDYIYLGLGQEGVVFRDNQYVYKVYLPMYSGENQTWLARGLSFFTNPALEESRHLYPIKILPNDVIRYEYEPSVPCFGFSLDEVVSFVAECWRYRIVIKDCKPKNFIRVDGIIKLIDMKGCDYDDNLFLNMCARMYLYATVALSSIRPEIRKITRSAINNFDIPELAGFREFMNRVYANIMYEESKNVVYSYGLAQAELFEDYCFDELPNLEWLFFSKLKEGKYLKGVSFDNVRLSKESYFKPETVRIEYTPVAELPISVSLLIKCCAQDVRTLEENVKHIVRQLSCPNTFAEVVLGIDPYVGEYLRQYNHEGTLENLLKIADKLVEENVIDRYVIHDEANNAAINGRWFDLPSQYSHTADLKPVTPQLFAIESCTGDFVLQADSDAMIGRDDYCHPYLQEMLAQMLNNDSVISVGFNIPNKESKAFFGFENGGFVPEIRLGLFNKKILLSILPLPNSLDENGKLTKSWFRALEIKQHETGICSIRGGDKRTFYIHPQNYRKKEPNSWMSILDKVEQNDIPECQYGEFDCAGSLQDWCGAKRNEDVVVVSVFRNVRYDRFLRFWASLISQTDQSFGILLYDDNSDNGLPLFIDSLIKDYRHRVTFVKGRSRATRMENEFRCIHNYMGNQESVVVLVDGDDALIGNNVIRELHDKYRFWHTDVVVGRFHQTYRIQAHYRYPVDFVRPRERGGNVWQHLKTFKKYLFDSVPLSYFKHEGDEKLSSNRWFETVDDYAMMVPIVELSEKPMQSDFVNYYYERDFNHKDDDRDLKESCIAEILQKSALKTGGYTKGRKSFFPDFTKIEIDITHDCNLKCLGCNRSCGLAPTTDRISIDAIDKFIADSKALGIRWKLINILGGEPTLHPQFLEIIQKIHVEYIDEYSPATILQVVSNGYTESSRMLCNKILKYKNVRIDSGSYKKSNKVDYFTPFNDAPCDKPSHSTNDYSKGCWVAKHCGLGLNHLGYYGCAVCGGIDRVMGKFIGAASLEELTTPLILHHFELFCHLCGNFTAYESNYGDFIPRAEKEPFKNIVSRSWEELYRTYNQGEKKTEEAGGEIESLV